MALGAAEVGAVED